MRWRACFSRGIADVPPARVGGAIFLTDGQIHDIPGVNQALGFDAPIHGLITGKADEFDRRIEIVRAPQDIPDTRLAIGSNAASVWWLNGEQVISLFNDRQTVIDDGVSKRVTLTKGLNAIRAAVINAGGATDFCARFLDAQDNPVRDIVVRLSSPEPR